MAVAVDYYELLNIPRSATADQINTAVKAGLRLWSKRTTASELSDRQEAETNVAHISKAREILLNADRRRSYDDELNREGVKRTEVEASDGDWLRQAYEYLGRSDYHSAAYAAREATHTVGNSAESWWIRSRANAGLGKLHDALYEANQAVSIEDSNAGYHFHLGCVHEELESWDKAMGEFQTASRLDPQNPGYQLAIGGLYLARGRANQALPVIETVYKADPNDEAACYYMGSVLTELAEAVPRVRTSDGYVITNEMEISQMRGYITRAKSIKNLPAEVRENIRGIEQYLEHMQAKKLSPPWGAFMPSSCLGVVLFVAVVMAPVWLVISGISYLSQGSAGGLFLMLLGGGLGYLWYRLSWVPNWKVSARIHK